jgi:hypothetical protein
MTRTPSPSQSLGPRVIRSPFPGDHWWYPERTFWRIRARFGERVETLEGSGTRAAATGFRARD